MKKQTILLVLILVGFSGVGFSQMTGQIATNMSSGGAAQGATAGAVSSLLGPISEAKAKTTFNFDDFQGSPYVTNTFLPTIIYYDDEKVGDLFYRYNALNEEIEVKQTNMETEAIRALGRDKKINILVEGRPMRFATFIDKSGNTLNGYLIQLVDGEKYDLFKRYRVKYTEGAPAANSFVKATPHRFAQFVEYYYQEAGVNRIDEIEQKNGKLYKMVGSEMKDAVKAFIKENNIDVKEQGDLVQVFQFLNN